MFLLNLLKINLYLALVMATFNRLTDSSKSLLIGSSDDPVFDDLTKEIIMTKFSFPEYDLWKLSKKFNKGLHKVLVYVSDRNTSKNPRQMRRLKHYHNPRNLGELTLKLIDSINTNIGRQHIG